MKVSLYRLICDTIKADEFISVEELNLLDKFCKHYGISRKDMIESTEMTLSEAIERLRKLDSSTKSAMLNDISAIPMSDGDGCSQEESMLLQTFSMAFKGEGAKVISMPSTDLPIGMTQIIYVEHKAGGHANTVLDNDSAFEDLYGTVRLGGFELIYIPRFAKHYSEYTDKEDIGRVLSIIAPDQTEEQATNTIAILQHLTTRYFYSSILMGKLQMPLEIEKPIWLIRIADDVVDGKNYANFLCIDVQKDVRGQLKQFVTAVNARMHEYGIIVNAKRDFRNDFMYSGFYKTILDVLTIKDVDRWGIRFRLYGDGADAFCDPLSGKKTVLTIWKGNEEYPIAVSARDAAFYVLLLCASISPEGSVDFYDMKAFGSIQAKYENLYQRLSRRSTDGDSEFKRCPDVTASQTRIPMRSRLSTAIKASPLTEQALYLPQQLGKGKLHVPLEPERIQVMDSSGSIRSLRDSVLYKEYFA